MKRITSLNLLYPPFLFRLMRGLKAANEDGIPLQPFETLRTPERQSYLYAKGRTTEGSIVTRARAGRSWHQYGIAADLVLIIDGKWSWDHHHLYVKAAPYFESQGLKWLGRNSKFVELVHYQLPIDDSIYQIESIHKNQGILGVWDKFNLRYGDKDLWKN